MIVLYILLGLVALILLLLCLPLKVRLQLREDGGLKVCAKVAFFPLFQHPPKEMPFRKKDYSPRAIAKRERKRAKKAACDRKRKQVPSQADQPKKKPTLSQRISKLTDTLSLITSLIEALHGRLFRSAHVHLYRFFIRIGTGDAAKTALLYGALCPAARILLESINECSNLHLHHPNQLRVYPDFTGENFSAELDICITLRVFHALSLVIDALKHLTLHKQSKTQGRPVAPRRA